MVMRHFLLALLALLWSGAAFAQTGPIGMSPGSVAVRSLPSLPAGSNAIGTVGVTALPAIPTGSNTIGAVNAIQSGTWNVGTITTLPALAAGTNNIGIVAAPVVTPISSTVLETGHSLKASAGTFFGAVVTTTTVAGWVLVFNSATVPADGTVAPVYAMQIPAGVTQGIAQFLVGATFSTGISIAFSTTGPFTKTSSATAFFTGMVQ